MVDPQDKSLLWKISHYTVMALTSRFAMLATVLCTLIWIYYDPDPKSRVDAWLAGSAGLLCQTIVRDAKPRDTFFTKELQDIDDTLCDVRQDIKELKEWLVTSKNDTHQN